MARGRADYYSHGSWNVICDRCGNKYKAEELQVEWDGLRVCVECWEPRQPQDFVRAKVDQIAPPYTKPETTDVFIKYCTLHGSSAIPELAIPGCMIPGRNYILVDNRYPFCTSDSVLGLAGHGAADCATVGKVY